MAILRSHNFQLRQILRIHQTHRFLFEFTTIKSSMFRSLKIFSASAARAFSEMQIGFRVITVFSGCDRNLRRRPCAGGSRRR